MLRELIRTSDLGSTFTVTFSDPKLPLYHFDIEFARLDRVIAGASVPRRLCWLLWDNFAASHPEQADVLAAVSRPSATVIAPPTPGLILARLDLVDCVRWCQERLWSSSVPVVGSVGRLQLSGRVRPADLKPRRLAIADLSDLGYIVT